MDLTIGSPYVVLRAIVPNRILGRTTIDPNGPGSPVPRAAILISGVVASEERPLPTRISYCEQPVGAGPSFTVYRGSDHSPLCKCCLPPPFPSCASTNVVAAASSATERVNMVMKEREYYVEGKMESTKTKDNQCG
jgi:hypothetical protein